VVIPFGGDTLSHYLSTVMGEVFPLCGEKDAVCVRVGLL
jgi:hypothetical protein